MVATSLLVMQAFEDTKQIQRMVISRALGKDNRGLISVKEEN